MSNVRLFFALWPDGVLRATLKQAAELSKVGAEAPRVEPASLHMTLAFIGEIPATGVSLVERVAAGAARRTAPFEVRFDAYEYWPKPEVVVAAARTISSGLGALWQLLHTELLELGWAEKPKKLRPHVTLIRHVREEPTLPALEPFTWSAAQFCLVQSEIGGTRPVYTVLSTWPLLYDAEET